MRAFLTAFALILAVPSAAVAVSATVNFRNCQNGYEMDVLVFNGGDSMQWVAAERADNLRFGDQRALSCEASVCTFHAAYEPVDGSRPQQTYKYLYQLRDGEHACLYVVGPSRTFDLDVTGSACSCRPEGPR